MGNIIEIIKGPSPFKLMNEMKPCEFAIIEDDRYPEYKGNLVLRTASVSSFEVINLSDFREAKCWVGEGSNVRVRPVECNITIKVIEK